MSIEIVFTDDRSHAVCFCLDVQLPEGPYNVEVRVTGNVRIPSPRSRTWDSFFLDGPRVSDDFVPERASQLQAERDAL